MPQSGIAGPGARGGQHMEATGQEVIPYTNCADVPGLAADRRRPRGELAHVGHGLVRLQLVSASLSNRFCGRWSVVDAPDRDGENGAKWW